MADVKKTTVTTTTATTVTPPTKVEAGVHYQRDENGQWVRQSDPVIVKTGSQHTTAWYLHPLLIFAGVTVAAGVALYVFRKGEADMSK